MNLDNCHIPGAPGWIHRIRNTHFGETQTQMAARLGISERQWRRWETGESRMPLRSVIALRVIIHDPTVSLA